MHIPKPLLLIAFMVASVAPLTTGAQRPTPAAPRPAPPSYSRDVAPILRAACIGCHGEQNPANGLSLTSYMALVKGGKSGPCITPGKGADSRIVKMMLGTLQPKMPPSGGGLKQADIDKIRLWIDAGAKADAAPEIAAAGTRRPVIKTAARPVIVRTASVGKVLAAPAPVTALAFSPDGNVLAVGTYREVQFWNPETRQITGVWTGHADAVRALAYSKDGKLLIAAGGPPSIAGEVRVWDAAAGKELRAFGGEHTDTINGFALSPDASKVATASSDRTLKIWEVATGKCVNTLRDHADAVWAVAWSPDGKYLASASSDRSIKVWDAATGRRRYSLIAHDDVIDSLEFSPDGSQLLSASADKTAKTWYFGPDGCNAARTFGHDGPVNGASFCGENGTVATASGDKTVKIWSDGSPKFTLKDPKDWAYVVRMSPDRKRIAAGTWDGEILVWSAKDGKLEGKASTLRLH